MLQNILNGKDEKKKKRQAKWDKKPKANKEKDSKDKEIQRYKYAEKEKFNDVVRSLAFIFRPLEYDSDIYSQVGNQVKCKDY